ncbi:PH-like domain-containing protein [Kocuria tytonis]|uniref:ABC transporter permease n=1 Tax=Kocuria tytonis TaxID=2054280 RepID=A0A495A8J6_9MICC|nr:ABC transporter permease [Kocuria tytonis]RKQ36361.1 ABC transporter permease [Kocuria tytonis]
MSDKLLPTLLTALIVVLLFALLWWGWRGRVRRQSGVAELPHAPQDLMQRATVRVEGMYVVTTYADQPLERIARHGLGVRTNAEAVVAPDGVFLNRQGAPDVFIPRAELRGVSTASGMVGKFVERDGLVVFTWDLGDTRVDTGFRARSGEGSHELEDAASALLGA